jgi:hypothetical protein
MADAKEAISTTQSYINQLNTDALTLAQEKGVDITLASNEVLALNNSYLREANRLKQAGYTPTAPYYDPTTGTIATSFVLHGSNNPDVQVIKFDKSVDNEFKTVSEVAFDREMQQKGFGNFAANNDKKASKTEAVFVTPQQ